MVIHPGWEPTASTCNMVYLRFFTVPRVLSLTCLSQADFVLSETAAVSWAADSRFENALWWSRLMPMPIRK